MNKTHFIKKLISRKNKRRSRGDFNWGFYLAAVTCAVFVIGGGILLSWQLWQQARLGLANDTTVAFDDLGRRDWCSSSLKKSLNSNFYLDILGSGIRNYLDYYWNDCTAAPIALVTAELWNNTKNIYAGAISNGYYLPTNVNQAWAISQQIGTDVYTIDGQTGVTALASETSVYEYDVLPAIKLANVNVCVLTGGGTRDNPYHLGDLSLCDPTPTPTTSPPSSSDVTAPVCDSWSSASLSSQSNEGAIFALGNCHDDGGSGLAGDNNYQCVTAYAYGSTCHVTVKDNAGNARTYTSPANPYHGSTSTPTPTPTPTPATSRTPTPTSPVPTPTVAPILDRDGDGLTDEREQELGTDPLKKDTDGDGYGDGWEVENGYDPLRGDSHPDYNGQPNLDSDGDGYSDLEEIMAGSDPSDPRSVPGKASAIVASAGEDNLATRLQGLSQSFLGQHLSFLPDTYNLTKAIAQALGMDEAQALALVANLQLVTQSAGMLLFLLLCFPLALLAGFFPIKRGRVFEQETKHPVAGALLSVSKEQQFVSARISGRDGTFAGWKLTNGQYQVLVSHSAYTFPDLATPPLIPGRSMIWAPMVGGQAIATSQSAPKRLAQIGGNLIFFGLNFLSWLWPFALILVILLVLLYTTWLNLLLLLAFAPAIYRKIQLGRPVYNLHGKISLAEQEASGLFLECYHAQSKALVTTTLTDQAGRFQLYLVPGQDYLLKAPHFYFILGTGGGATYLVVKATSETLELKVKSTELEEANN
jgi:hypothetical protein